jgi:hypothetical protein
MMPGPGALDEAELSEALDQICLAEGVVRSNQQGGLKPYSLLAQSMLLDDQKGKL